MGKKIMILFKFFVIAIYSTQFVFCDDSECIELNYSSFLCNTTFSDPRFLKTTKENVLHIGVSLKIINKSNNKENKNDFDGAFKDNIKVFFSHLLQLSTGGTQHWIIITDSNSIKILNDLIRNIVSKHLTTNLILNWEGR